MLVGRGWCCCLCDAGEKIQKERRGEDKGKSVVWVFEKVKKRKKRRKIQTSRYNNQVFTTKKTI